MFFPVCDNSNTTHVTATNDHCQISIIKLDVILNLASFDVKSDGVMNTQYWIWVTDCASIVGYTVRDTLGTNSYSLNSAQLVLKRILYGQ
jgi:hypothetical protein